MPSDLGGKRGRLISHSDRKHYSQWINEALQAGARQQQACELLGITARTYQRWHQNDTIMEDQRLHHTAPAHNRLSDKVRKQIIELVNQPQYSHLTPHQIVPSLLDKEQYLASESSFYRIMKQHGQLKHRNKGKAAQRKNPQALTATAPNQIYSWDITYLMSSVKGIYHYLYLVMDIYSRKIVGWQIHDCESSSHAAELIQDIALREKIDKDQLIIHSDNGSPMKGATLRAKMEDLGIAPSYSRPRISNDNPYSESLFKTIKYHYSFPEAPFENLTEARLWVDGFERWYNNEHKHSSIKFVTPNQRHNGLDGEILAKRKKVLEQAKQQYPARWNGRKTKNMDLISVVHLNPNKELRQAGSGHQQLEQAA